MSRLTRVDLSDSERAVLEQGSKHGKTHGFRQRCQMILLKACRKPSREIAAKLGCCMVVVNHWVKRYQAEGLEGLHVRKGRGRKTILSSEQDLPVVRRVVQENRQRLRLAQERLQAELGKEFSTTTLKRFLKSITADTSDCVAE